jgi:hypothetical protein
MSWHKDIQENTLEIPEAFWTDLFENREEEETGFFSPDHLDSPEELKDEAFEYFDEHTCSWLGYSKNEFIDKLMKKHLVSGRILFCEEIDGGEGSEIWGYEFEDGVKYKIDVVITYQRGKQLT